jgi:single-strand DNA-binding protein
VYQQIILIGNLGSDPELRHTASGTPVCAFRMAVNKRWVTPEGEKREKTVWFRVTTWKKQAEIVNQYLTKGKQVMVIGEVEEASVFVNKAGDPAASLEVTATTIKFMGGGELGEEATARKVAQAVGKRVSEADIPF